MAITPTKIKSTPIQALEEATWERIAAEVGSEVGFDTRGAGE